LNAGIAGVRAVQGAGPRIPISLSIDRGDAPNQPQTHYGLMQLSTIPPDPMNPNASPTGGGVTDFDIEGVDYYPTTSNLASQMKANLTALATTNYNNSVDPLVNPGHLPLKKIMLLETNSPWRNSGVGDANQFAKTKAGQQAEFQTVRDMIYNLPHDDGEGVLWWYPEAVPFVSDGVYNNGDTALFDGAAGSNHNALQAMDVLNVGDYNRDGVVDAADYTVWRATLGSTTDLHANGNNAGASAGVIDQADYDYWVAHFADGSAAGAGAGSTGAVPEPPSWILLVGVCGAGVFGRCARRSR
jgi:Glycosyl hydrolase family 53